MAPSLACTSISRTSILSRDAVNHSQIRHATLIRRPKRPYTFTQLVTLSDGSTFVHRTTSPNPLYVSTKDVRNAPLWNPSSQKLLNVEEDEAGKLKAFRERFGSGFDQDTRSKVERPGEDGAQKQESMLDLISGAGQQAKKQGTMRGKAVSEKKGSK